MAPSQSNFLKAHLDQSTSTEHFSRVFSLALRTYHLTIFLHLLLDGLRLMSAFQPWSCLHRPAIRSAGDLRDFFHLLHPATELHASYYASRKCSADDSWKTNHKAALSGGRPVHQHATAAVEAEGQKYLVIVRDCRSFQPSLGCR